eukprot:g16536.t1
MNRRHPNNDGKFTKESLAGLKELEEVLEQRRAEMSQQWSNLDQGWVELERKMSEAGMSMGSPNAPDVMNVGGSDVVVPRFLLDGTKGWSTAKTLRDLLGGGKWDGRLPKDFNGQVFLDTSPACFQHLIDNVLSTRPEMPGLRSGMAANDLPADDLHYLPLVAGIFCFPTEMEREGSLWQLACEARLNYLNRTPPLIDCSKILGINDKDLLSTFLGTNDNMVLSTPELEDDVQRFGASVAETLKRERIALHHAQSELVQANERATAAVQALAIMYGPRVAQGEEDPIIEFSVRGGRGSTKRMMTLLSTIRVCPPASVLAVRLERWSQNDSDKDADGRWQINDCSPPLFTKLLDVLRLKKRAYWDGDGNLFRENVSIVVVWCKHRSSFEKLVNMYFPGCESFVMGSVEFRTEPRVP